MGVTNTKKGTDTILAIWASLIFIVATLSQFNLLPGLEGVTLQILSLLTTFIASAIVFIEYGRGNIFKSLGKRTVTFISVIAIVLTLDVGIKVFALLGMSIPFFSNLAGTIDAIISFLAIVGIFT